MIYNKGDKIQNYRMLLDDGSVIETEKLTGKWVILYFYPKDDTPGCTKEAKTFSSMKNDFDEQNSVIFGVNTDTPESHRSFKEKYNLDLTLVTDHEKKLSHDFSVKVLAGFCSRDTVLINPEGRLEETFRGVNPSGHPAEILEFIKNRSLN